MNKLSDYYGPVTECKSCMAARNAADVPERACRQCFGRGFVAECMGCAGKGYVVEAVAGAAAGTMNSTCNKCGGNGCFAVPKPDGWVAPEETKKLESATA